MSWYNDMGKKHNRCVIVPIDKNLETETNMDVKELVELLSGFDEAANIVLFANGTGYVVTDKMFSFHDVDALLDLLRRKQTPPDYKSLFSVVDGKLVADFSNIKISSENDVPLSIAKWEVMFDVMNKFGKIIIGGAGTTCACCIVHELGSNGICYGCPIKKHTGSRGCKDTPYQDYLTAVAHGNLYKAMKAAHAEVVFLKSLMEK